MCDNIETAIVLNNVPNVKEEVGKKSAVDNASAVLKRESGEDVQLPTFSSGVEDPVFISLNEIKEENNEEAVGISEVTCNLCEEQTKFKEEIKVEDSITEIASTESDGNLDLSWPLVKNILPKAFSPDAHCDLVKEETEYQDMKIEDTPYERKDADEKNDKNIAIPGSKFNLLQVPEEQNMHVNDSLQKDGFKNDLRGNASEILKQPFVCDVCNRAFLVMSRLETHFRIHTGVKPFKCGECGKAFVSKSNLTVHMLTHTGIRPHECDVCGKCFTQNQHLIKHRRTHNGVGPYKCQICADQFYTREEVKVHKNMHKQNFFTCFECNKTFSAANALKKHEKIHTGDGPYKCMQCGKRFYEMHHLNVHAQSHELPFKCTECDKSFKHNSSLENHIKLHQGVRPFKCAHCEKSFTLLTFLHNHMIVHSGVRPFKCELCGKDFPRKASLRTHLRLHTGDCPFKCKECSKTFPLLSRLNKHIKIHEEGSS